MRVEQFGIFSGSNLGLVDYGQKRQGLTKSICCGWVFGFGVCEAFGARRIMNSGRDWHFSSWSDLKGLDDRVYFAPSTGK